MTTKILITGSTGYIGGSVLTTLVTSHPEYQITALLRSSPPPAAFTKKYPNVHTIHGDYDSASVISTAASTANIVIHCGDSDHEPSIRALIAGLLHRPASEPPAFLIHLSGTGIVADWKQPSRTPGTLNSKIYSDIADIDELWSLPDDALHRNVDKIVQAAWEQQGERLKTAIVCPPDIYGRGRGAVRTQSVYMPFLVRECERIGRPFYAGDGGNARSWVHVEDLMVVYLSLVEAAAAGGGGAGWGRDGYYFAASQEASQIDVSRAAGKLLKAKGIIPDSEPVQLPTKQIDAMMASMGIPLIGRYMFASNSRTRSDRARKVLGYEPAAPSLFDTLEADIDDAIASLRD
ncbi:NAD(P)-binding protein [Saccharata proteae CBS 121410]|uniref:NAD(P)-binding protein n=1 Tax=Saccharata proteae CBS 121410 TaxID=1314787 RepID=A0A6A5YAR2_9PEZI|nr:NAD(P)-binding protein [Saccharata proteae CBS 121410]